MADYDPFAVDEPEVVAKTETKGPTSNAVDGDTLEIIEKCINNVVNDSAPWDKAPNPMPDLTWYMPSCSLDTWKHGELKLELGQGICYVTLNRPNQDNKFNDMMYTAFADVTMNLQFRKDLRVVVLSGAGAIFCGGGDHPLNDNSKAFRREHQPPGQQESIDGILKRAQKGGAFPNGDVKEGYMLKMKLFHTWSVLPQFSFALVNGSAIDDGVGIACMCDMVIALRSAFFALTEVKQGFAHSLIAPYLTSKLGMGTAKRMVASCANLSAERAKLVGMCNELVDTTEEAHTLIKDLCEVLTACGPRSVEAAKQLVMGVGGKPITEFIMFYTGKMLAMVTISDEARDGMVCLQARKPKPWEEKPIKPLYG